MSLSSSERALRSRIGGYRRWANVTDRSAATAKSRAAFLTRFYADTDPKLPEKVRLQQAEAARKAYFADLAYRSARARRKAA